VEVVLVELPGRGGRLREPPFRSAPPLIRALGEAFPVEACGEFALFGHSMGAILAFELARYLRRNRLRLPSVIFASGHVAPQLPERRRDLHTLPDGQLVEALRQLGGTPPEVFEQPELLELLLPIIRADLEVNELYEYREEPPLDVPLVLFGGSEDTDVGLEDLDAWGVQTTAACERKLLPGDHFFLHSAEHAVLEAVRGRLLKLAPQ
jgi:medium-chain acyl-[acyl-carrier-protein] hydrolase